MVDDVVGSFSSVEILPSGDQTACVPFSHPVRPYDAAIVSRPHNMQYLKAAAGADLSLAAARAFTTPKHFMRFARLAAESSPANRLASECCEFIDAELHLTHGCQAVLTVSQRECLLFAGAAPTFQSSRTPSTARPTPRTFSDRQSILFVGAFGHNRRTKTPRCSLP